MPTSAVVRTGTPRRIASKAARPKFSDSDVMANTRDDSPIVTHFEPGTRIEVLDVAGAWIWGCLGPQGPSGYMKAHCLED